MAEEEPRFWTRSGHPALDLALSGGDEGVRAHWERLHAPADLEDWIEVAVPEVGRVWADEADLDRARRLRDAIWELVRASSGGEPLPRGAVAAVNEEAARPGLCPELGARGGLRWRAATASDVLAHLAVEAVTLLGGPRAGRVRVCEGERCSLLFLDTSPSGRRRWCSMERCGNRAKVRAHRARTGA